MPASVAITKKRPSVKITDGVTFMIRASIRPIPSAARQITPRRSKRSVREAVESVEIANAIEPTASRKPTVDSDTS